MKFLINASNIKVGGGVQVTDSICRALGQFEQHEFVVVLSSWIRSIRKVCASFANVKVYEYDIKNSLETLLSGRDAFLDQLVQSEGVDAVLTVFGPSRWNPRCKHLCGFASAQLVLKDSPYYIQRLPLSLWCKEKVRNTILRWYYKACGPNYYTENPYISEKVKSLFGVPTVYTVTNYYNQVFDQGNRWVPYALPPFDGITLLTVTAAYPHKNLGIAVKAARILEERKVDFDFRFVLTVHETEMGSIPEPLRRHFLFIGKVDIAVCPSLYRQADIMFQPTLLECFTATYPEAMKMEVPILTTDLEFARGLCGDAALYYSPLSAEDAACKIEQLATDSALRARLVAAGKEQLRRYDSYQQRVEKLIYLLENL